jgi:hypothetical protein
MADKPFSDEVAKFLGSAAAWVLSGLLTGTGIMLAIVAFTTWLIEPREISAENLAAIAAACNPEATR